MKKRRKRTARPAKDDKPAAKANSGAAAIRAASPPAPEGAAADAVSKAQPVPAPESMSTYVFTFELTRQYPTVRSFMVKQPLKRSFFDNFSELLGGSKKGTYRI